MPSDAIRNTSVFGDCTCPRERFSLFHQESVDCTRVPEYRRVKNPQIRPREREEAIDTQQNSTSGFALLLFCRLAADLDVVGIHPSLRASGALFLAF